VRPLAGREPELERALRSTGDFVRDATARVVFAVRDAGDGAAPIARRVAAELRARGLDAEVVVTHARAPNLKAAQLARVVAGSSADVIVSIDSDVDLAGLDLARMLDPLSDPRVGAVWAPPVEAPSAPTLADRASAAILGASLHAFPLLACIDEDGMVGKAFAIRRSELDAVGGFDALDDVLGEDIELARRLTARRSEIAACPFVVRSLASGRTFADVIARFARWLSVVRTQRPALLASYPVLFFPTPPILALALVAPHGTSVLASLAVVALARVAVAIVGARIAGRSMVAAVAWAPIADLVLALAFVRAVSSRTVVWRGRTLMLGPRGRLMRV
jgi:ceramide glucosyltransferase